MKLVVFAVIKKITKLPMRIYDNILFMNADTCISILLSVVPKAFSNFIKKIFSKTNGMNLLRGNT